MPKTFPRTGAWTKVGKKVGIINAIGANGAEVHMVDELGETTDVVKDVAVDKLHQATYNDIPVPRRPARKIAAQLGYTGTD